MRKGMAQGLARPLLTDRNPAPKNLTTGVSQFGPHAGTQRWSYTVPAGRKFLWSYLQYLLYRNGVATTAGEASVTSVYTPNGGSASHVGWTQLLTNVVGDNNKTVAAPGFVMNAGDVLTCSTADASTGGTVVYNGVMAGTEGDA